MCDPLSHWILPIISASLCFQEVCKHFSHIQWHSTIRGDPRRLRLPLLTRCITTNTDLEPSEQITSTMSGSMMAGSRRWERPLQLSHHAPAGQPRSWRTITCSSAATFAGSEILFISESYRYIMLKTKPFDFDSFSCYHVVGKLYNVNITKSVNITSFSLWFMIPITSYV